MAGTHAWLMSDEVYGPMVHDGRSAPLPSMHPMLRARTIVAGSFGKLFHATGWKIGWLAAPANVTTELRKVHQYDVFSTGAPIQAGLAAYLPTPEAQEHLTTVGPVYEQKRDRLLRGLEGTALTWTPAEGGYFQVVGVSRYLKPGESDGDLARRWTREHGVATIPMGAFGDSWEPAVRICFAKEDATLDQAIGLLKAIPVEPPQDERTVPTTREDTAQTKALKVLALQDDLVWQDPEANRSHFARVIERELKAKPADLVVLPEMFTSGFAMDPGHVEDLMHRAEEQPRIGCSNWHSAIRPPLSAAWRSEITMGSPATACGLPTPKEVCGITTSCTCSRWLESTTPMRQGSTGLKCLGGVGASSFKFVTTCASQPS